jgi:hypothetical protein
MVARGLAVLAAIVVVASPVTAFGMPGAAPRLHLGLLGNPARFAHETGQHSSTRLLIVGWGQGSTPSYLTQLLSSMLDEPMLGINTSSQSGGESISPAAIAAGRGDTFLLALNSALAGWGRPVFVRPLAEMNGHWNAYSAFNANGSPRGSDHSTAAFRKAFARIYLIVHGGADVNSRLRALGLPPVARQPLPAPYVEVIWNPQGYGSPDLPGNSAAAYYPGDAYVDVVGDDLYDIGGKAAWPAAAALYAAHPHKPFAIGEWGLWDVDDVSFVTRMATFLRRHPRIVVANYYSGKPGSVFDLESKPRSLAAYRSLISPLAG